MVNPAAAASAEDACGKGAQPLGVFGRRTGVLRGGEDEGPDAALRFDDAGAFELGVHARDRVGVDPEFDGELADGRELLAGCMRPVAMAARSPRSSCA